MIQAPHSRHLTLATLKRLLLVHLRTSRTLPRTLPLELAWVMQLERLPHLTLMKSQSTSPHSLRLEAVLVVIACPRSLSPWLGRSLATLGLPFHPPSRASRLQSSSASREPRVLSAPALPLTLALVHQHEPSSQLTPTGTRSPVLPHLFWFKGALGAPRCLRSP